MSDDNFWPGPGLFDVEVVGESHYQRNIERIAGPLSDDGIRAEFVADIILEKDNPHDPNAVRVDIAGLTVGHLSRNDAPAIRAALKPAGIKSGMSVQVKAVIVGGRTGQNFGVWLDIPTVRTPTGKPPKKPWWKFGRS